MDHDRATVDGKLLPQQWEISVCVEMDDPAPRHLKLSPFAGEVPDLAVGLVPGATKDGVLVRRDVHTARVVVRPGQSTCPRYIQGEIMHVPVVSNRILKGALPSQAGVH